MWNDGNVSAGVVEYSGVAVLEVLVDFLDELLVLLVDTCVLVVGVPLATAMKARHSVRRID